MVSSILRDAVRVCSMLRDAVTVSHPKIYCTVFLGVAFMMPGWQVSSFLAGEPKTSVSPMTGHSWSMLRCEGVPMFGITSDSGGCPLLTPKTWNRRIHCPNQWEQIYHNFHITAFPAVRFWLFPFVVPTLELINMEQIYRFGSKTTLPMPRSGIIAFFANAVKPAISNEQFWI